jgi:hypothetical protein
VDSSAQVDWSERRGFVVALDVDSEGGLPWRQSMRLSHLPALAPQPIATAPFESLPPSLDEKANFARWERDFREFLYREQVLVIWRCAQLGADSRPGETEGEFRARLQLLAAERRDRESERLTQRFASRFQSLRTRIQRAEERVADESAQYRQKRLDSWVHVGQTIFGAIFGRKKLSKTNVDKASRSIRTAGRAAKEHSDIERAEESLDSLRDRMQLLEKEFDEALQSLQSKLDVAQIHLEEIRVRPRKSDLAIEAFGILWTPRPTTDDGASRGRTSGG